MGAAASPSAVYLGADDFSGHAAGSAPDGWEGSTKYKVELEGNNPVLGITGSNGPADYFFAGDLAWTDVVVTARLRVIDTAGDHYGLWVRANGTSNFNTIFFGLATNQSLQVYNCRIASASATTLSSSTQLRGWTLIPAAGTSWHTIEVRALGGTLRYVFDGVEKGTTSNSAQPQGRIGLCAGYPASRALWDDVVVRRFVDPEPAVAAGATETRCP
jgi:hypothetical protein